MKGQLDVCSPIVDLSEGQISHIAPILEGGADGGADVCLPHVRAVVVDVVGQALLSPTACRRRTVFFFFKDTILDQGHGCETFSSFGGSTHPALCI